MGIDPFLSEDYKLGKVIIGFPQSEQTMKFKNLAMVGLMGVVMLTKGLCSDPENADLKKWQEIAAAIKPGTPLAEVKKILGINHVRCYAMGGPVGVLNVEDGKLGGYSTGGGLWTDFPLGPHITAQVHSKPNLDQCPVMSVTVQKDTNSLFDKP